MTPDTVLAGAARLADMLKPGDLDATLSQITAAAVELIPDASMASITVRHGDRLETVDATNRDVLALDAAQYALRQGPCYDAATDAAPRDRAGPRDRPSVPGLRPASRRGRDQRTGGVPPLRTQRRHTGSAEPVLHQARRLRRPRGHRRAVPQPGGRRHRLRARGVEPQRGARDAPPSARPGHVMERYHLNDERACLSRAPSTATSARRVAERSSPGPRMPGPRRGRRTGVWSEVDDAGSVDTVDVIPVR
jgi:hypothetical protein